VSRVAPRNARRGITHRARQDLLQQQRLERAAVGQLRGSEAQERVQLHCRVAPRRLAGERAEACEPEADVLSVLLQLGAPLRQQVQQREGDHVVP
jgi:hypothetical protein